MSKFKVELEFDTGLTESAVESIFTDLLGPDSEIVEIEKIEEDE